ncbi:NADH-quinone oxidoreductase subunit C [Streptomyces sp. NPDC021224]|uniref:NADH-quinone oxidoreductase subunit C n=1 Tax=unclassified Streptomyces TaxID=2593676 RepID=UPI0037A4E0F0
MTGWLPREAAEIFGPDAVAEEAYDLLTVDVPAAGWVAALTAARDELGCTFFDWLSAVDEPGTGFLVCAHVAALSDGPGPVRRLLLRTAVGHEAPALASATGVYAGADWHERETHEMFGVAFTGHPGLAPLLLPEEFEGHPLRKDFVLAARVAKAWPGAKEPGESHDGGPRRRQMQPPGVPDPNEWGPLKGQLPDAPARPARTARTPRTGAAGPGGTGAGTGAGTTGAAERPPRRNRSASDGSASQTRPQPPAAPASPATPAAPTPDAPWQRPARPERPARPAPEKPEAAPEKPGPGPGEPPAGPASAPNERPAPNEPPAEGGDSA